MSASLSTADFSLGQSVSGVRADTVLSTIPSILNVTTSSSVVLGVTYYFATLTLSQSVDASTLQLQIFASGVTDVSGNALQGGDFSLPILFLPGDANRDGVVNVSDETFASSQTGTLLVGGTIPTKIGTWSEFADVNGSGGAIAANDLLNIKNRKGSRLQ